MLKRLQYLPMTHAFELYINKDAVTTDDFSNLYTSLSGYLGTFKKIRFHILFSNNHIRYFIQSDRDLSAISSSITFCVLKPVDTKVVSLPQHVSRERFVNFVTGGTLLDLREKMSVKKGKTLEHFVCDVQRLTSSKAHTTIRMYFKNAGGGWTLSKKLTNKFPAHLFALDFTTANNFMKSEVPKYLNIEKVLHMIVPENINALLEIDTFPYFQKSYHLNLPAYEFDKHSMIVGASGSGKSKFIELFIDRLNRMPNRYNYRIVVIDPHANLANDLRGIEGSKVMDFNGESAELFAGAEADVTAATELTTTLMKSLMGDSFNPRVERVLRFSLFVLFTSQRMSLGMLKRFLTDLELRQQMLDHVEGHVPHNIIQFFSTDYNEIRTAFYNEGLLPIIAIVDELELQPTLLAENGISLQQTINNNFLTVFSLNKVSMGEKVVKTIAGLLIQQIFLLAQSKAFNERVLLFIDEVSVVQSPALSSILSEARKFNLFVILTQQYFAQVDKSLKDSIFANVSNYYCFRVAEEDAEQLVGNLPMELPKEMLLESKDRGIKEETMKMRMLTDLHPRECIVRLASNGMLLPCFKARTLDVSHNIVQTFTADNFVPQEYTEAKVVLKKFQENTKKSDKYTELPKQSDETTPHTEPPPGHHSPPPLAMVEIEPILERGPISLDEIMSQQSTKDTVESRKELK
jgi:hypothetical protein